MELPLTEQNKIDLKKLHRGTKDKLRADRVKIIVMIDKGFTDIQISEALMLDIETVIKWKNKFSEARTVGEFLNFNYVVYKGKLTNVQLTLISEFVDNHIITDSKQVIQFIKEKFLIEYSLSGANSLLKKIGFSYKQLIKFNNKTDVLEQEKFVNEFNMIQENLKNTESILFLDAVHPQHNSSCSKAWIKKGEEKFIQCNTGRERLNLNGAYNPITNEVITVEGDKIDSDNTIKLFKKIEKNFLDTETFFAFTDNAKYYKSIKVREYLKTSKIKLIHLPAYCPNLNLIERLWKFMRKKVINTTYYEKFIDFKKAILSFFENIKLHNEELKKFIGLNMHIIKPNYPKTNLV